MATNPRQPVPFAHDSSTILKPILDQLVLHSSLLVFTCFYKHFVGTHLGLTEHTHTQTPNSNRFYHHNFRLKWIETNNIKQPKCINMRHKLRTFHLWCLVAKKCLFCSKQFLQVQSFTKALNHRQGSCDLLHCCANHLSLG